MANDIFVFKMIVSKKSGERYVSMISLIEWLSDAKKKNPHFTEFIEFAIDEFRRCPSDHYYPVRELDNWLSSNKENHLELSWFIDFFIRQLWKETHTVN